jgi:hypothetical protein
MNNLDVLILVLIIHSVPLMIKEKESSQIAIIIGNASLIYAKETQMIMKSNFHSLRHEIQAVEPTSVSI